ncbi:MAG TPA: alpha/beta hydrolase [Solirubrobacteraceae bacterium]|nr:alpha/beta hydrolase [Solirubrobacteraceae bacterium]
MASALFDSRASHGDGVFESAPVRHVFLRADERRLHLLDFGGTGPVILLLHGILGHSWMWHEVAPRLTDLGRVLALDSRGYGDSQWSREAQYTSDDHASDVQTVLNALGGGAADVVGFSSGGLVALGLAARCPELVSSLVMVDIAPASSLAETDVPEVPGEYGDHGQALEAERRLSPRAAERMLEAMALFGTRPVADGKLARKHDGFFLSRWPFRADQRWVELAALEQPVLIVRASESPVLSAAEAARMVGIARNGLLVEVEGSGHLVPVEQPHALAEAIRAFLAGWRPR